MSHAVSYKWPHPVLPALLCHVIFLMWYSIITPYWHDPALSYYSLSHHFHFWVPQGTQKISWRWRQAWRRLTDTQEALSGTTRKSPRNHSVKRQRKTGCTYVLTATCFPTFLFNLKIIAWASLFCVGDSSHLRSCHFVGICIIFAAWYFEHYLQALLLSLNYISLWLCWYLTFYLISTMASKAIQIHCTWPVTRPNLLTPPH